MPSEPSDWSLYRSFAAVISEGSLSAAARLLRMSQPTLSRHIRELEEALELKLFTRSPHGVVPTEEALALAPQANALAAAAQALYRTASRPLGENGGTVRLSVSEIFAAHIIMPIVAEVQRAHPDIVVELVVSNRMTDILRRDADIAVRMTRPTQDDLWAKRIGDLELGLFCSPTYLTDRSPPIEAKYLFDHAIVGFDFPAAYTATFKVGGHTLTRDQFTVRTDSDVGQFAAICAGCGIGVCHVPLAERFGLRRVLTDDFAPNVEAWLVMHQDLKEFQRYRTLFDALDASLRLYLGYAQPVRRNSPGKPV